MNVSRLICFVCFILFVFVLFVFVLLTLRSISRALNLGAFSISWISRSSVLIKRHKLSEKKKKKKKKKKEEKPKPIEGKTNL
jgi:hypothetical protein